jgi:hypothetical protein
MPTPAEKKNMLGLRFFTGGPEVKDIHDEFPFIGESTLRDEIAGLVRFERWYMQFGTGFP